MPNHQEKLSLLQDLYALSKVDDHVGFLEIDFIHNIALGLGVSELEFQHLKDNSVPFTPENKEIARITQFYRLVLLMGVDNERHQKEIKFCKEAGLKMGLNPMAVNEIINQIIKSETSTLPPDQIIKIFQTFHN